MSESILECSDLRRVFSSNGAEVEALAAFSFSARAGEFVSLFGPSGCGKTTLLLVAGGLLAPTSGTLQVCGENPYALSSSARAAFRARNIGFLFQQFHLVAYLDVLDNVLAPTLAGPFPNAEERARELLDKFQLGHRLHHVPAKLSTGEQQRVALVRSLLRKPRILYADEPTGNLDKDNAALVLDHLEAFAQDGGTVLMATHDSEALQRTTCRVELEKV
tara:strand:- start:86 stop:742 length:657 start_codon:yes stop_codon:yes gene_type:complete